jgi:hypothetical protein
MAFNPLATFQKNRRFWMSLILMICMVSFIFFGFKGGCDERTFNWRGTGPGVVAIDGRNYSRKDLDDLKTQRNVVNTYMKTCTRICYEKLEKDFYETGKDDKDLEARQKRQTLLHAVLTTLAQRKIRPRYFDGDVKFNDLVEFKLWQSEADRLGIQLQERDVTFLFKAEFFGVLGPEEVQKAEMEAHRELREASPAYIRNAVKEEFRVKIAQYAVLSSQPYAFRAMRKQEGGELKLLDPEYPDETRAPMTLAQVWDFYKARRSEFAVKLIPVYVEEFAKNKYDFASKVSDPNDQLLRDFYEAHKTDPYDPSSEKWGLEVPQKIQIQYLLADPTRPDYVGLARTLEQLKAVSPVAYDPLQSPLTTAMRYALVEKAHQTELETQYSNLLKDRARDMRERYRGAALLFEKDSASPILAYYAGRHPQAVASLVGASVLAPNEAMAGFLAWGTKKYPLEGKTLTGAEAAAALGAGDDAPKEKDAKDKDSKEKVSKDKDSKDKDKVSKDKDKVAEKAKEKAVDKDLKVLVNLATNDAELEAALHSELRRRAPIYATLFASSLAQNPLDIATTYINMDPALTYAKLGIVPAWAYFHPILTTETVQHKLEEMIAMRQAEEWAQENISAAKPKLEAAAGDPDKLKRALEEVVDQYKLTYGPSDDKKGNYYDRFTVDSAPELAPLREAYLKYMDEINLFEGREPERRLKPGDFNKMFFDATERFSSAAKYRAMPWPPEVELNRTRDVRFLAGPSLYKDIDPDALDNLRKEMSKINPASREVPKIAMYKTAPKPILFWRTGEIAAHRPADFAQAKSDLQAQTDAIARLEKELKQKHQDDTVQAKLDEAKRKEADLKYVIDRVTEGWKMKRARDEAALPYAKTVAQTLIDFNSAPGVIDVQAAKLKGDSKDKKYDVITIPRLSQMEAHQVMGNAVDYFPPTLPKDTFVYPTDKMMADILSLYDLKQPISVGSKGLDEINKELYEKVAKAKPFRPDGFVQIIPNKPRTVYYIAAVTTVPRAEEGPFLHAMLGAPYADSPLRKQDARLRSPRDYFLDRAQHVFADEYRQEYIRGLKEAHGYKLLDDKAAAEFDGIRGE